MKLYVLIIIFNARFSIIEKWAFFYNYFPISNHKKTFNEVIFSSTETTVLQSHNILKTLHLGVFLQSKQNPILISK